MGPREAWRQREGGVGVKMRAVVYAIVRDDLDSKPWVDLGTVGHSPSKAEKIFKRASLAEGRPFSERNPKLRVARFLMEELR